jgi:hypothetical protein
MGRLLGNVPLAHGVLQIEVSDNRLLVEGLRNLKIRIIY